MRIKILASILCVSVLLLAAAGCGKKSSGDTSPSGSPAKPDSSQSVDITPDISILMGLVSGVYGSSLSLDLVRPSNSTSTETVDGDSVKVGSQTYDITGESLTIELADSAVIMLTDRGYSVGTTDDINVGDLLAVAMNGELAAVIVDNGTGVADDGTGGGDVPADPGTEPTDNPETGVTATYTVNTDRLYVRSGPATTAPTIGTLTKGATVTGIVTDGWLKFTYQGQTGYCSAQYLTKTETETPEPGGEVTPGVPDSGKTGTYMVTTDGLNIRISPSTSATVLGKLPKGSLVSGTVKDGWLEFKFNNETGYCSAQYLTDAVTSSGGGTGGVPDSSTVASYVVVTDGLNVRTGPSTGDTLLGQLPKGAKLSGTVKDGWLKFTYNGRIAYVKGTYIAKA